MTVQTTASRADYTGNGSTTVFSVPFYFIDQTHILVLRTQISTGVATTLALTTDYTVSGVGVSTGGSITCLVAPTTDQKISILRNIPLTQLTHYVENDPFPAASHETALDKLTMEVQQVNEIAGRALQLPANTTGVSTSLPYPSSNKLIGWNSAATGLQNVDQATLATIVAFGTARYDLFSGTGAQTAFTLAANPGALANLDVNISGVTQRPGTDYTWTSGTTITFTSAPPSGTNNVLVRYLQGLPQGASDSASAAFIQAGTGAVSRVAQDKLRESVSVVDFGADPTGAADSTVAIQAAINALSLSGGGRLIFPPGNYKHTTQLVFKNNISYIGGGYQSTRLTYTGTSDGVVVQNPINSSTIANIYVEGLYFKAASTATARGAFFDTGSSLLSFARCFFDSSAVGLILDQSELVSVVDCYMAGAAAGAWLVNGADRNVGASSFFTNRIKFDGCQFNGSGAYIGVADDGGNAHDFISCNFNAGTNYIRACGVYGLNVIGGELEVCTGSGINIVATKWQSGAAALKCESVTVNGAYWYQAGTNSCIAVAASMCDTLTVSGNTFQTNSTTVISGADNVSLLDARGNVQIGAGEGFNAPNKINNYYGPVTGSVTWTGATTNPAIGNGTFTANVSRAGRRVTLTVLVSMGSTTTYGSGNWQFSLPVTGTSINDIGSAFYICGGGLYVGIARVQISSNNIILFSANNTSNAVQSTVPAVWANGNSLEFTVTYTAANQLG